MSKKETVWFAIEITVDSNASEAIEFALNELDALGTEINDFGKLPNETLPVIGYFNEKPDEENLKFHISNSLRIYGFSDDAIKRIEWREVENRDWLAEWKKHWKPTETAKFIIAPMWETIKNTDKIIIRIEPSMAFGTGTHETTKLCLKAIEDAYESNMSFLDVGTGTGILAVGAAKIQGKSKKAKGRILACDTDLDSIVIAKENAEINETENIEFYVGSISDETPEFDFVCANLTADVILPLLPIMIEKSKSILVLSGILKEQEDLIVSKLKKSQISNFKIETDGEWISVQVKSKK
ncbi:50S ribosomal protein L11 methyltransferase [soil metagenome]